MTETIERPIDPDTNEPYMFWRVSATGFDRTMMPRQLTALTFAECPTRNGQYTSYPLRGPFVVATGLFDHEDMVLRKMARILNEHWHKPEYNESKAPCQAEEQPA